MDEILEFLKKEGLHKKGIADWYPTNDSRFFRGDLYITEKRIFWQNRYEDVGQTDNERMMSIIFPVLTALTDTSSPTKFPRFDLLFNVINKVTAEVDNDKNITFINIYTNHNQTIRLVFYDNLKWFSWISEAVEASRQ